MTTNLSKGQAFQVRVGQGPLTLRGFAFFVALHCDFGSKEIKIKRPNSILLTQKYIFLMRSTTFHFNFFHISFTKSHFWGKWLMLMTTRIKKGIIESTTDLPQTNGTNWALASLSMEQRWPLLSKVVCEAKRLKSHKKAWEDSDNCDLLQFRLFSSVSDEILITTFFCKLKYSWKQYTLEI